MGAVERVRVLEVHAEEAARDRVPEGRAAGLVDDAAQFREHLVGEARAVEPDEQIAAAREQHAEAAGALVGVEEQAAHLRASLEIGAQAQHLGAEGLAQLRRSLGHRADPVGVERLHHPDLAEHLAGAAHLAGLVMLQHEDEQIALGIALFAREGVFGSRQLGDQRALVGGQVGEAAAGQLRHLVDRLEILVPRRSYSEAHSASPVGEAQDRQRRQLRALDQALDDQIFLVRMDRAAARAHRIDHRHAAGRDIVAVADPARVAPADVLAEIGAGALDQFEQFPRARVDRLGRPAEAAMAVDPHVVLHHHHRDRLVELGLRARLILGRPRPHVDPQHRLVGHDIVRPAAVDPGRIDGQPRPLQRREPQRQIGRRQHGVAPVLGIAPGMGAAPLDLDREIAAARPRAGQRSVGQRGWLVGQRRFLAARRRAISAAEPGEPTSSSLLITTS